MPIPTLQKWLSANPNDCRAAEKIAATIGGGLSIFVLIAFSFWVLPEAGAVPVVASMGASAVLLFAVPQGALSQPWPVIAGHGISAVIGVICARYIPHPSMATACAVGLAIGAMHQLKCLHPPGGATAFTAVMGGDAIHKLGFQFVIFPVLINAVLMVLLALTIHGLIVKLSSHSNTAVAKNDLINP